MKLTSVVILSGAVLFSSLGYAHKSNVGVEWTAESLQAELQAMPKGSVLRGKQLSQDMMCASCHGEAGKPVTSNWPSIAGHPADYTYKTLLDYKQGRFKHRSAESMHHLVGLLSKRDMADLAAFYAKQPISSALMPPKMTKADWNKANNLVNQGDPNRGVMACVGCHGVKGEGADQTPTLAGQEPLYFENTMRAYKQATRVTDSYGMMRMVAASLSEQDIKLLAAYYANLPAQKKEK